MNSRRLPLLALFTVLLAAGCGDDDHPAVDAGGSDGAARDAGFDAGPDYDAGPDNDGGTDAGPDVDGGPPPGPTITICPGDALPSLASGACEVTAGTDALLITADVLTPGEVFRGGQVLVDATGMIACVGCDCSTAAGAAGATAVSCPDGVLSPGLINAHDHITFTQNVPYSRTEERYEQRHDWRRGLRGHTRLASGGGASRDELAWGELRFVVGGSTSTNGSGTSTGLLRNLDRASMEGLGQPQVDYDTFPLGDTGGTQLASGCGYPAIATAASIAADDSYTPHIAEGIDTVARNEFLCVREGANDLVQPQTAIIHGIGLLPPDIAEMAATGTALIWSPRSNVTLYGDTARVTEYKRLGVLIALGTDWVISGSMNELRELACADELNATYFDHAFTDEELWLMATRNAAEALAVDDAIGTIANGLVADLTIFDASARGDHRAVIGAHPDDVVLVLRGGHALYGDDAVVSALPGAAACDSLDVCARAKRVCLSADLAGRTLADLETANIGSYPLFFCDVPDNEPSCVPERNAMGSLPSPVIAGSTRYTGLASGADADGDGIDDASDLCPRVFDPIRPVDNGSQADFDGDGVGDACDPCPLAASVTMCPTTDPNDRDGDGVVNATDNCPDVPNADQSDRDSDLRGDVCDACPDASNPAPAACPATIYDIKTGTIAVGERVSVTGAVVTAVGASGFFAQVDPASAAWTGPDNSGIFVFTSTAPTVARGDRVNITTAQITDYFGQLELTGPSVATTASGVALPTPVTATPAELTTGGARAAALEGALVRVSSVTVTDPAPAPAGGETAPTNEFLVDSVLRVDDFLYRTTPYPVMSESFGSITGVLAYRRSNSKLNPRDAADLVTGVPVIASLSPALSYARAGAASGPTFPTPLTVSLARAASADTTVTVTASGGGGLVVTDVVIAAGATSAVVPARGVTASPTPYTVTATLGTSMQTADVRVLGATERPTLTALTPPTAVVPTGGAQPFRVTLAFPAPAGGIAVLLAVDMAGTVPAMITVPADALEASFDFTAGAAAAMGHITATLDAVVLGADVTVRVGAPGGLVINEIDYDQPGTDTTEFVELYNGGSVSVDLTNVAVVFVNGAATSNREYLRVALSDALGPGEYLVIANAGVVVPPGVAVFRLPDNVIQNGAPDGVAIVDTSTGTLIDSLSYEGAMTAAMITGIAGTVSLVEGTALAASVADSATGAGSLARIPNGSDTGNSSVDWSFVASPSPGAAN